MLCVRSELNVMNFCFIVGLSLGGLDELHVIDDGFSDIEDTIKGDKVDEFVQRVDFQLSEAKPCAIDGELDLAQVIKCIISHDTVRCATALFQLRMDANVVTKNGYYPLHYAAKSLSPSIIEHFLELGARPDVLCLDYGGKDVGLTPLVMALKTAICNNKAVLDWSPSECIFKLIFLLCLPELVHALSILLI
ncbi:unnamed protein product [Cuscuta campestris]|uniref:Uncharacterized protein n=1 Tax=Cuscuta campestris TaxID=132261 RepID=A0A484N273_9ASTE|nr:unnamed protein product [Cuscuta campestris]